MTRRKDKAAERTAAEWVDPDKEAFADLVKLLNAGEGDAAFARLRAYGLDKYSDGWDEGHNYALGG